MGSINSLGDKQEQYRADLQEMQSQGDPTLEDTITQHSSYPEDVVVNIASSLHDIFRSDEEPDKNEIIWAIGLLDDLDTLGMVVRFKDNGPAE